MATAGFVVRNRVKSSAYHIAANRLRTTRIAAIETESPTVKTFTFRDAQCAKAQPGQFLMLWIPGVDEIPLSILDADEGNMVSVAVKKVGEATQALHRAGPGDIIGVRGPFGNSFSMSKGRLLMAAGGTGTAPLLFLAKKLKPRMSNSVFVLGAKTKSELLFMSRLEEVLDKTKARLVTSTEDGTCGIMGLCTKPVEQILVKAKFNNIYACGPEKMIQRVFQLAEKNKTNLEASLERLMRCAIGLCGSCTIGRYRVCTDGPVFTSRQLREVKTEFGKAKRGLTGRMVPLD
jgi:dihydroorotate dehydrogenase electron transfer subunit